MNTIKKFFAAFTTPTQKFEVVDLLPVPKEWTVPTFLLPTTGEEYNDKFLRLRAEAAERMKIRSTETKGFEERIALLERKTGSSSADELNRREVERLRYEIRQRHIASGAETDPWTGLGAAERKLRDSLFQKEKENIAHEGEILLASRKEVVPKGTIEERRLVLFGGRHFVCLLIYSPVLAPTGRQIDGRRGYMGAPSGLEPEMAPTGEYKPPGINWATDSVAQFTDEELRACQQ